MSADCRGSIRTPRRSTAVRAQTWGLCRRCGVWRQLTLTGLIKPHKTSSELPPSSYHTNHPYR